MHESDPLHRLSVQPPLEIDRDGTGTRLRISDTKFLYLKITGISGSAYAWTQQQYNSSGVASNAVPANSGTTSLRPAYEVTGSTSVATDGSAIVQAWLSDDGQSYLFQQGGGGGGGLTISGISVVWGGDLTLQSIPSGTWTLVDWAGSGVFGVSGTGIVYDSHTKLTIDGPTADRFPFISGAGVTFESNSTGVRGIAISYSGAGAAACQMVPASGGGQETSLNITASPINLPNGVYVQVWVYQDSGSSLMIGSHQKTVGGQSFETAFWVWQMGSSTGSSGGSQITAMLASDATNLTNTLANLSDLSVDLLLGDYAGRLDLWVQNSTAAEGLQFDFGGGSATFSNFLAGGGIFATGSATYTQVNTIASSFTTVINWSTVTGLVNIVFDFSLTCNAAGTFIPRFAENSAHTSGTVTIKKGSNLRIDPVA